MSEPDALPNGLPAKVSDEQREEVLRALEAAPLVENLPFYEEARKERLLDLILKRWYAVVLLTLLGLQIVVVDFVLVMYAWKGVAWRVEPLVINVWLAATVIEVIAVVLVVTQHLFPRRGDEPRSS